MHRLLGALALGTALVMRPATGASAAPDYCGTGQAMFQNGFATLRAQVGSAMGGPTECEHPNSANGDTLQATTTGLAFYRQSTNTPTFTDGYNHWALTGDGLVAWTGNSIDPPGTVIAEPPISVPPAAPAPQPVAPLPPPLAPTRPLPAVALHDWQVPGAGAVAVDPRLDEVLTDLWSWGVGRQLLRDGVKRGVRMWIQPLPEPFGGYLFGDYSTYTHDIRINERELQGANAWVVAGTIAHELTHAEDDLNGLPMNTSTSACYQTEIHAFATMIDWDAFANTNYRQNTGPMAAELWGLRQKWGLRSIFGDELTVRVLVDEILRDYGESCGGRSQP